MKLQDKAGILQHMSLFTAFTKRDLLSARSFKGVFVKCVILIFDSFCLIIPQKNDTKCCHAISHASPMRSLSNS